MNFIRRLNRGNFLFFKLDFSNLGVHWLYVSHDKIQNFNSISLKLCLLDQKNTGTWGVNNIIVRPYSTSGALFRLFLQQTCQNIARKSSISLVH